MTRSRSTAALLMGTLLTVVGCGPESFQGDLICHRDYIEGFERPRETAKPLVGAATSRITAMKVFVTGHRGAIYAQSNYITPGADEPSKIATSRRSYDAANLVLNLVDDKGIPDDEIVDATENNVVFIVDRDSLAKEGLNVDFSAARHVYSLEEYKKLVSRIQRSGNGTFPDPVPKVEPPKVEDRKPSDSVTAAEAGELKDEDLSNYRATRGKLLNAVIVERSKDGSHRLIFGDGRFRNFGSPEDIPDALLALLLSNQIPTDIVTLRFVGFSEAEPEGLLRNCEARVGENLPEAIVEAVQSKSGRVGADFSASLEKRFDFSRKTIEVIERSDLPDGRQEVDIVVRAPAEGRAEGEANVTTTVIANRDVPRSLIQGLVALIRSLLERLLSGAISAEELKVRVQRELNSLRASNRDFDSVRVRVRVNAADIIILQRDRAHGPSKRQPA